MEFFEVVQKRKAIRKYLPGKTIPQKDIDRILDTINLAPSAKHLQSFKVFVVKSKAGIEKIFQSCYNQQPDFIRNAALILIFCTDPKNAIEYFGERGNMYALQDATIAATFTMLVATDLGYDSCWVGNFKENGVKKALKTNLTPVAAIIIGISNEDPVRPDRKPLDILSETI